MVIVENPKKEYKFLKRNGVKEPFVKDLELNVLSWNSYDIEDEVAEESDNEYENKYKPKNYRFVITGYGVTDEGYSVQIDINNFKPFFYCSVPKDWTSYNIKRFINKVKANLRNADGLNCIKSVYKKELYFFKNNESFKKLYFEFNSQKCYYETRKLLENGLKLTSKFTFIPELYECNIPQMLRFFHKKNIQPSGWIKVVRKKLKTIKTKNSKCNYHFSCDYDNVEFINKNKFAPFLIGCFDIECTSLDGSFPNPQRPEDKVIQIGTTIHKYGDKECFMKHIAVLGECEDIEGVHIECYKTEKELILGWADLVSKHLDLDILSGYNIWGFDFMYLYERAVKYK